MDFTALGTGLVTSLQTAITQIMPVLAVIIGIKVSWKFVKGFLKSA